MLVKNYMTTNVVTVGESDSLLQAMEAMRGGRFHSLPVVDDLKRVLGVITEKEVNRACPADANMLSRQELNTLLGRFKVKSLMRRDVINVHPEDSVEFAAYKFYKFESSAFPVVDNDNRLVGIIAQKDIFRSFIEIMAMNKPCTRLTIETQDKVGVVAELTSLFKEANINILSFVSRVPGDGSATINIRADLQNQGLGIIGKISDAGYKVTDVQHYEALD